MIKMDNIKVSFILASDYNDPEDACDIMKQAFESCKQHSVNVSWIKESDFDAIRFAKTDFVVFEEFKGQHFDSLQESKCVRIVGPWCLLVCLMEGRPIPNFPWPIYNMAMSSCVVSCSHIPKTKKLEIRDKIQLMGGCYTDSLMSSNTHLITESVKSEKYLQAAEHGVKLMVSSWVDAVWNASLANNIHCNDPEFNKYKCLPFHNLTICSTGFPNIELRSQVAQSVAQNGGVFTASLVLANTDILVVYGTNGILSQKYKAARGNPNIHCVSLEWIEHSIEKGYALPHNLYTVKKGTSTPTKENETCPDFSVISAIGDTTTRNVTTLEETVVSKTVQQSFAVPKQISPNKRKCSSGDELERLINGLDIKRAKRAGQYLDGCNVFLAGFKAEQREKLTKILNLSGATRYDDISDRLTHIIVGDTSCHEVKIVKSKNYAVSLVSLHWLLDSIEKHQALDEENYLINLHNIDKSQFSSPLGRKGLSLLRSHKTLTSDDLEEAHKSSQEVEVDDDIMQQYLTPASKNEDSDTFVNLLKGVEGFNTNPDVTEASKEPEVSSQASEFDDVSQDVQIFHAKKFVFINFNAEETQKLRHQVESAGGEVMPKTYKGIPDYVVASMFLASTLHASALESVNSLWIDESIQECEELEVLYYHRPVVVTQTKPLESLVVTISGYSSFERAFLSDLIEHLGGVSQDQLARVLAVEKKLLASTHLLSLKAEGKKYVAALKWELPVVSKDWLLECANTGKLVAEDRFLVGESKPPNRSQISETILSSASKSKSSFFKDQGILTPVNRKQPLDITKFKTPINKKLHGDSPDPCSQVTPINKLMEEVRRTNLLGTPKTPPVPSTWYDIKTPESPFGAFIRPHLSPKSKKEIMRYINHIPDFVPPPQEKKSTPLSEVKRRCWRKLLGQQDSPYNQSQTVTKSDMDENVKPSTSRAEELPKTEDNNAANVGAEESICEDILDTKLKQIEQMVTALGESRRKSRAEQNRKSIQCQVAVDADSCLGHVPNKDSQPFSVGWDFNDEITPNRIFVISGVEIDQRQAIVDKIESLGGQVSDLNSYDPKCTHLICPKPARNEKTLSCMAAGKWILHISYVDKCVSAGKFLPEEAFEFGNPKSKDNVKQVYDRETESRIQSIHWWRKEIFRRGYKAFNDMRAIVVAQKREPIMRVIEAGGGTVVDVSPPFGANIHATHCLLEARSVPDFSVYNPLAQQGILCINTLYISEFLYRTNKDIKDAILPHFSKYYS